MILRPPPSPRAAEPWRAARHTARNEGRAAQGPAALRFRQTRAWQKMLGRCAGRSYRRFFLALGKAGAAKTIGRHVTCLKKFVPLNQLL